MNILDIYEKMLDEAIAKGDVDLAKSIGDALVDYCERGR